MQYLARAILTVGPKIIYSYFAWMRRFAKHGDRYSIEEKYLKLHKLAKSVLKALGGQVTVVGKENIPSETCCFICNHINLTDPLIFLAELDRPMTFVCKKEIQKIPFVNKCVNDIEGEFIDRENLKASLRTMMKVQEDLKSHRKNWLIFPEGTRNRDSRSLLLPFHHGTFRAPTKAEVPIVPCCVYGTQRLFNKNVKINKFPIYLEIGKPLYPKEYKEMSNQEIAETIQSRVQQMISYKARKVDRNNLANMLGDKFKENL